MSLSRPRAQRQQLRTQQVPIGRRRRAFLLLTECDSCLGRDLPGLLGHRGLDDQHPPREQSPDHGGKTPFSGRVLPLAATCPRHTKGAPGPCSDVSADRQRARGTYQAAPLQRWGDFLHVRIQFTLFQTPLHGYFNHISPY